MARVMTDNKNYMDIGDSLRRKTGNTSRIKPMEMATEIDAVYEAGKTKERSDFWETYQIKGTRRTYYAGFYGAGWTDETFKPKYLMKPTNGHGMFNSSKITKIPDGMLDISSDCTNAQYMFAGTQLKSVEGICKTDDSGDDYYLDFSSCPNIYYTFQNAKKLEMINTIRVHMDTDFEDTFYGCTNLKNITFLEHKEERHNYSIGSALDFRYSPYLTKESITSIVKGLASHGVGSYIYFSLTAVNNAFETTQGAADGSETEEWLALIETRSRWRIYLV